MKIKRARKTTFELLWRNKFLTADAMGIKGMYRALRAAANKLEDMEKDGLKLDPHGGTSDDYAMLITTDPALAGKYGMEERPSQ